MDETPEFENEETAMRQRIAELKRKLEEMAGGYSGGAVEDLPPEMELAFLEHIYQLECEPTTTYAKQLIEHGVSLPPPESLPDAALTAKLEEIFQALGERGVFLDNTNHLIDRALYQRLWKDTLNEETWDISGMPNGSVFLDMTGSGSEADTRDWLQYFATDEERSDWVARFPDTDLPPRSTPPSDRDTRLPRAD